MEKKGPLIIATIDGEDISSHDEVERHVAICEAKMNWTLVSAENVKITNISSDALTNAQNDKSNVGAQLNDVWIGWSRFVMQ
jgi:hypothetical protein